MVGAAKPLMRGNNNRNNSSREIDMAMTTQSQTQGNAFPHEPSKLTVVDGRRSKRGWIVAGLILLVFAGILGYGIFSRLRKDAKVRPDTAQMAVPAVCVFTPQRSAPSQEIVLRGNVQPFVSAPIYSRTNGYLRRG